MATGNQSFIIGIDTGGTFTDIVVLDSSGEITTSKARTTPSDPRSLVAGTSTSQIFLSIHWPAIEKMNKP